ncbi:hypothetical protein GCM10008090_21050 [Arenicella chitinivorans]|uniref:2OG-Fe(II) oxygenase n=1 Tax=Arenicella chitinivorans TaxID=1329800 RepID=A0A918VNY1_9GAMM|nr:2OG-Fe(II) oxygenase [Arenicella chitinivorans]GHA11080.1 hypothetical protein GCM10008090_21050 [Arenicella chitinivorans]
MSVRRLFKWRGGRQASGYDKLFLGGAHWPIRFDIYLLRFPTGSCVPEHKDEVDDGQHYRLNIVLRNAREEGVFNYEAPIFETRRIKFFRPDTSLHSVSKIEAGVRYVFSIGWLTHK